jgi:hypothetical protein
MSAAHDALVAHLLAHSVRTGDFTLKSGKRSRWFIDAKQTTCRADGMLLVADAALEVIPDDATAIGGLTMGADAVAFGIAAIAATRGRELRSFSVRKEVKGHGGGGRIAGALQPGDRVVMTVAAPSRRWPPVKASPCAPSSPPSTSGSPTRGDAYATQRAMMSWQPSSRTEPRLKSSTPMPAWALSAVRRKRTSRRS